MNWQDRIRAQDSIGLALVSAYLLFERDGMAALKGVTWTDADRERVEAGLKAFKDMSRIDRD